MAKKQQQIIPVKSNIVQVDTLRDYLRRTSEKGTSTAAADNITPLVKALQRGSPEVNKKNAGYIEGAEAGDFLLKNAPDPLIKGSEGFFFQACHAQHVWVEWVPREKGGGFAGVIASDKDARGNLVPPQGAERSKANKFDYVMPNGNEVKETRYLNGYVMWGLSLAKTQKEIDPYDASTWYCAYNYKSMLPYSITFTSTAHSVYRTWMGVVNSQRFPTTPEEQELIDKGERGSAKPNLWAKLWHLTTHESTNVKGTWSKMDISLVPAFREHFLTMDDLTRGEQMFNAFESGEKQVEAPEPEPEEVESSGGRM